MTEIKFKINGQKWSLKTICSQEGPEMLDAMINTGYREAQYAKRASYF